jgi:hypothetical protein
VLAYITGSVGLATSAVSHYINFPLMVSFAFSIFKSFSFLPPHKQMAQIKASALCIKPRLFTQCKIMVLPEGHHHFDLKACATLPCANSADHNYSGFIRCSNSPVAGAFYY